VAAAVVTFFTFLPSFVFILAGGPLVEATTASWVSPRRCRRSRRPSSGNPESGDVLCLPRALAPGLWRAFRCAVGFIAIAAAWHLFRFKVGVIRCSAPAHAAGLAVTWLLPLLR